jgi:hypothetical protein
MRTKDVMRAVLDALTAEVKRTADEMDAELQSGELGSLALTNRSERCIEALRKVEAYEQTLGQRLGHLSSQIEGLRASIGAALMAAQAEEEGEAA